MNPFEAFTYLRDHNLPLVVSFPVEEERGHVVTASGICMVGELHGSSRVTLSRFNPFGMLVFLATQRSFYVTYEIEGKTYGCLLRGVTIEKNAISANIPAEAGSYLRKCVRVEPSSASPVMLYLHSDGMGTRMFRVQDISEHGFGLMADEDLNLEKNLLCGIGLPFDGGTFLLVRATVVYSMEIGKGPNPRVRGTGGTGFAYGFEIFPHPEDAKKIRLYVMHRELEIREMLREPW